MTDAHQGTESGASIFEVLTPLVREWRLVLGFPLGAGVIAAAVALLLPLSYTATTTFVPAISGSGATMPGGLASLASQFGLNLGAGPVVSPDFFAEVLTSRELLKATLLSQFQGRALLDILKIEGKTPEARVNEGIRDLEKHIYQRVDRRTGIVTLSVTGAPPALAAAVANRMVELLNTFNLERLQSQSRERRRFVGERLQQAERELRDAEAQHLRFLQANRRYAGSPLLAFEENRLSRQVQLRQEVFQTLTREYEEARIAEVQDTPVLTVIDPATPPDRRSAPRRKLLVFFAMLAAGVSALPLVYLREYRRAAEQEVAAPYRGFLEAWRSTRAEWATALRLGNRHPRESMKEGSKQDAKRA